MNNIVLDVHGYRCLAEVFYHRNGEFKLQMPRKELHKYLAEFGNEIEIYFYFNMPWSEMILAHLVSELKAIGFHHIKLVCPYLPFGRADKPETNDGCLKNILSTFLKILKKIGIDEVCTYDFHLDVEDDVFYGIKFSSVKFSDIWEENLTVISKHHYDDKFIVFAPDKGANGRAFQAKNVLSYNLPNDPFYCKCIVLNKERTADGIKLYEPEKYVENEQYHNRICIIVDDMIDSGKTMMAAIEKVQGFKPKKIYVLVTHLLNDEFKAPADVEFMWKFDSVQEA